MTAARDTSTRHLTIVTDNTTDNRHSPPRQAVHRHRAGPESDPPLAVRARSTTPTVDHEMADRASGRSVRYWAVAFSVLAQLAIAAAIAVGGDPTMGAAAAIIMAVCGLALIAAETATNRPTPSDQQLDETPPNEETAR